MNKRDRIRLIETLLEHLNSWEGPSYAAADMALDELGFPALSESEYQSQGAYFRERLRLSSDSSLLELAELYGIPSPPFQDSEPVESELRAFRIFLSFISAHGDYATEVKTKMERLGFDAFLSHIDTESNTVWQENIERALDSCDALVALLTPGYNGSVWTDQEVGWAYGRKVPVIGVRLGMDPYGFIARLQGVTGENAEEVVTEVIAALKRDARSRHKVDRSLAHALEASPSYTATRAIFPYVNAIEHWDDSMLDAVERALTQNQWVDDTWYGSTKVGRLLEHILDRHRPSRSTRDEVHNLPFE